MKLAHDYLVDAYLDYRNNYLSIQTYADHNHLSLDEATKFLDSAKLVYENYLKMLLK